MPIISTHIAAIGVIWIGESVFGNNSLNTIVDNNDLPESIVDSENSNSDESIPDVDYPGDDPTVAPDGYEWRGFGEPGSKRGSYYNPRNKSSLHPDLNHNEPIGPHWDYSGLEGKFRIFPDAAYFQNERSFMNDWRLTNQLDYLFGKKLLRVNILAFPSIEHEHCVFCWDKFGHTDDTMHIGYCTQDKSDWICDKCFEDFKEMFKWLI